VIAGGGPEASHPGRSLRVLVADEDASALDALAAVLLGLGHEVAPYAVSTREAVERIATEDPDLAIVMVHRDDRHALDLISEAVEYAAGPVIAQVPDPQPGFAALAAELGVAAVVESLEPEAVQAAIEVALRRHAEVAALCERVEQLEGALTRRSVIERAKGIVMERHKIDERAAFEVLRSHARSESRRVVDVAQSVADGLAVSPDR
jgi:AmiR/NasT family two-component response regulator